MSKIRIQDARGFEDYKRCVDIQIDVWGLSELEVIPAIELITICRYGGVCLGAFDRDDMIGFVCGMVGREAGRVFHHSHMLAVRPSHQGRGIGEQLKWAQRERVIGQGLSLINWTFDPLQARNAQLNITRLGVEVGKYLENVYGETASPLHGGLPTDRFEAEWWLESARVREVREGRLQQRPGWETLPCVNRTGKKGEFTRCDEIDLNQDGQELLVEIPSDITTIMSQDPELARSWRLMTRKIFQNYFGRGYAIVGFHRSRGRSYYRIGTSL